MQFLGRYVDCGDGTVLDTVTSLIWLQQANCYSMVDFDTAEAAAATLADGTCGLTDGSAAGDWRLASKEEWETTVAAAVAVALGCTTSGVGDPPALTNALGLACFADGPASFTGVLGTNQYWATGFPAQVPPRAYVMLMGNGLIIDIGAEFLRPVWPVRAP